MSRQRHLPRLQRSPRGLVPTGLVPIGILAADLLPRRPFPAPLRAGRTHLLALLALAAALLCGASGCASGGSGAEGPVQKTGRPIELRYKAVAKDLSFGIVNESHTDRTDLYSAKQPLEHATTKVSPDEVVDAVVEYFRDQGFFEIAQSGRAPATPPAGTSQFLEVTLPEGAYHALLRPGVSAAYATTFQTCAKALLDIYNSTMQLQAVDRAPEWSGSEQQRPRTPKRSGG